MAINLFGGGESEVPQFIRTGKVTSVNPQNCTVRVTFEDRDESVSPDLQVVMKNTLNKKYYWMPEVDEIALCLFLPNGEETGYVIGTVYSDVDKPVPEIADEGKERVGIWIDQNNFIKWVEEERRFVVQTENPVLFEVR